MRWLVAPLLAAASAAASAQATSRPCAAGQQADDTTDDTADDTAGPACLLAHAHLGQPAAASVVWRLDTYPGIEAAQRDRAVTGTVVQAFGKVWKFSVGPPGPRSGTGEHVAQIGPIIVDTNTAYDAEFLKSTFSPGMAAPVHRHSGPEAFYAVTGATCLETPDGMQLERRPGNGIVIRGGPPMLLMAVGGQARKGFALILHDTALPPTTLAHDWQPKGLCRAAHGEQR
jgi:quercetin dioxygenase-like cupin family protein